jgi:hypothetical protein
MERLRKLQLEFGDPDVIIEDDSTLLSGTNTMTLRPHTIS